VSGESLNISARYRRDPRYAQRHLSRTTHLPELSAFLANDLHLPLVCVGTNEAKQALMTDMLSR
jgi:hypothetical protein